MDYEQLKLTDASVYMPTFGTRLPVVPQSGAGVMLFDAEGNGYLDFLSGIAVNALGYGDAEFTDAVCGQVKKLTHACNYFYNEPQTQLAQKLTKNTGYARVFFSNSGGEANECALKLALKYHYQKGAPRKKIVALADSFHGRTLATTAATGQARFHAAFQPLPYEFVYVPANDCAAMAQAIDGSTAAVIFEVIQGESGVHPLTPEFIQTIFAAAAQADALTICDEVQTGMGHTGRLLAQDHFGVRADITTLAKALGNGIPIGACLCSDRANVFEPGDHGTTFGGNLLACTAGNVVIDRLTQTDLLDHVQKTGACFKDSLLALQREFPQAIKEVRGQGLMLGAELSPAFDAHQVQLALLSRSVIVGTAGSNTLRLVPPLIIEPKHIEVLICELKEILSCQD